VDNWWCNENGFATIVGENMKLCFYMLRYDRITQVVMTIAGAAAVLLLYRRRCAAARKTSSDLSPVISGSDASEDRNPRIANEHVSGQNS
jgi:hypothetical protein